MKEIPSDKRLWHHVGSLCSKNCNTMSLTQLQSSWDNIVEIYLEIMLFSRLASWLPVDSAVLTRVTASRWRWAFVTFFRNPVLSSTENRAISSPHMVKTHPWRQSAEGERKKIKQNKQESKFLFDLGCEESVRRLPGRLSCVQASWQGSGFSSRGSGGSHKHTCDNVFGLLWENHQYFTNSDGVSFKISWF